MQITRYKTKEELKQKATELSREVYETSVCFYFHIFDGVGNAKEFHAFYKPISGPKVL